MKMDNSSFNDVVNSFKGKLFRLGLTMLRQREDAEDALQEIMLRLWSKREMFPELKSPEAYAMKMMKNLCLDKIKTSKDKKMVGLDHPELQAESFTPFTRASFNSLKELMLQLFGTLPEQQRIIIHMRDIEHYTFEEIEEITGMKINAIRVNLSRARKSVRSNYLKIKDYENR
jgi:RNA polymerase sigma-70 factor (ECF subfamily)